MRHTRRQRYQRDPLPRHEMEALRNAVAEQDHWQYLRYVEAINANGDPRETIFSFSEWLSDGKPAPRRRA